MATDPSQLIDDARNYAITVTTAATSALVGAISTVQNIGQGYVGGKPPEITLTPPVPGDPGTVPVYTGKHFEAKDFTTAKPTIDSTGGSFPSDPGGPPAISAYIEPIAPSGAADPSLLQGVPVVNTNITMPPAPNIDVAGIPKPVLIDLTIPDMPTYQPPEFQGVHPSQPATPPSDLDVRMRNEYSTIMPVMRDNTAAQIDVFIDHQFPQFRAAMATLEERLATYMEGGTALSPAVENAIYNRTLDKTNNEADKAKDDTWGKAARGGWRMPTPMLLMQQFNVDKDRRDNNARAAVDIAVKQAELEQNNLQFAVTQSANLRQIMLSTAMTYFTGLIQINGQALEYARSVVDAIVKVYDLAARYAEIQTRIYEADANVYRARVEGAMATIQAYEAQIRGVLAQAEVNTAKVNVYRALLEGAMTEAQVYKTQVEAVEGQISIERMKVELYNAKVQAFVAQVNGYTAQWQGYSAAVQGRLGSVQASAEQVRAYAARVQAYQARVQAAATEIESKIKVNTQKLEQYRTEVEAYKALIDANATAVNTEVNSYATTVQAFIAKANAIARKSESEIAVYHVAQQAILEGARLSYDYLREYDNMNVARATGTARIAEAIGGIYAGIAQSTLSGMNSLAAVTQTTSQ